jgi:hypothetical protein
VKNTCAIVSRSGTVVTVMKLQGQRGKKYRRDQKFNRRVSRRQERSKWVM